MLWVQMQSGVGSMLNDVGLQASKALGCFLFSAIEKRLITVLKIFLLNNVFGQTKSINVIFLNMSQQVKINTRLGKHNTKIEIAKKISADN